MSIPGSATPLTTQQITNGKPIPAHRLPGTDLWVATLGCAADTSLHDEQVMSSMLQQGVNVWMFAPAESEEAELTVGQFLVTATVSGELQRESLFIIERLGEIDAITEAWVQQRQSQKRPIQPILQQNGRRYSLHPKLLEQQLSHSLARLQLHTLDWVVLDNPPLLQQTLIENHPDALIPAMLKMETLAREELLQGYGLALPLEAIASNPRWLNHLLHWHESVCLKLNRSPEESAFRGILFTDVSSLNMLVNTTVSLWGKSVVLPEALDRLNWWGFVLASPRWLRSPAALDIASLPFPLILPCSQWPLLEASGKIPDFAGPQSSRQPDLKRR